MFQMEFISLSLGLYIKHVYEIQPVFSLLSELFFLEIFLHGHMNQLCSKKSWKPVV